eukprot:9478683-Pyramimonas_sp.AAC.1
MVGGPGFNSWGGGMVTEDGQTWMERVSQRQDQLTELRSSRLEYFQCNCPSIVGGNPRSATTATRVRA